MKELDVLIIYEHISREIESAIALKNELESRGYNTKIVQYAWTELEARLKYKPKVIIVPWCYDDNDIRYFRGFMGCIKGKYFKIINLHSEQIGNKENSAYMLPSGKAKDVYHFVWGEYFKNELLKSGIKDQLIKITGNSRLDFFKNPFNKVCLDKGEISSKFGIDNNKEWILIIGSFSGDVLRGNKLDNLAERGYGNISLYRDVVLSSYKNILAWIDAACSNKTVSDRYEIIYRPHPSEWITPELNDINNKYPNFHIHSELAIRDWMVNSDLLFAWNSTSAVEAVYANKSIFFLRPIPIPETLQSPLLEKVEKIESVEHFVKVILREGYNESILNDKFIEETKYYYANSDTPSIIRIANNIEKVMNDDQCLFCTNNSFIKRLRIYVNFQIKNYLYRKGLLGRLNKYQVVCSDILSPEAYLYYRSRIDKIRGSKNESK